MERKVFDWEYCKEMRSPGMYQFLKAMHNKPISEEDYIVMHQSVPKMAPGRGDRTPSGARSQYRNLKNTFGFFQ